MRRDEILAAIESIANAVNKSLLMKSLDRAISSPQDPNNANRVDPNIGSEVMESLRMFGASLIKNETAHEIVGSFQIDFLTNARKWMDLVSSRRQTEDAKKEVQSMLSVLRKFDELLAQEYVAEIEREDATLPEKLRGKALLPIVLVVEDGEVALSKDVSNVINSVSEIYNTALDLLGLPQEPLLVISVDSGSNITVNFGGNKNAIEVVKGWFTFLWRKAPVVRHTDVLEASALAEETWGTKGLINQMKEIAELKKGGQIPDEIINEAFAIISSHMDILKAKMAVPKDLYDKGFSSLPTIEKKLLSSASDLVQTTAILEDYSILEMANLEEKEFLKQLLKTLRGNDNDDLDKATTTEKEIMVQRVARRSGTMVRVFNLDSYEALLPRPTRKNYQYL